VRCDLAELDRRERSRGDRRIGEGRSHIEENLGLAKVRGWRRRATLLRPLGRGHRTLGH
jgi:hypothetical protein